MNLRVLTDALLAKVLLVVALALPGDASARETAELDAIQREARIVADVMKAALRSELSDGVRVTSVNAEYLAHQGVLVSVRLNAPWLTINDSDSSIAIAGEINLDEIPTMVENILSDLQIEVSPYEPEALEALRALRSEQRELRLEQRGIRAKLREKRRALVRAEDDGDREDVQEDIAELERELLAVDAQYDALAKDIDIQYEELRDYRSGRSGTSEPTPQPKADVDALIARTACDYGATLKSLSADNYLTIALRRDDHNEYYAFKMDHISSCSQGDMRTERLLDLAYRYSG